jgi:hypothetical protein
MDQVVALHMDAMFKEGATVNHGSLLLASLAHIYPELRGPWRALWPRASRALLAWKRRVPTDTRLPLPKCVAMAIAGLLIEAGRPSMAAWVAVVFVTYLRPGEAFKLKGRHLVPPSPAAGAAYQRWGILLHDVATQEAGKTGLHDESVVFDLDPWIVPVLQDLHASTPPDAPLWTFAAPELRRIYAQAMRALGLHQVSTHLYCLRHGGASDDLLSRRRDQLSVQMRGRWKSTGCLARYGKETKLLAEMATMHGDVFVFGRHCQDHFGPLFRANTLAGAGIAQLVPPSLTSALTWAMRHRASQSAPAGALSRKLRRH